MSISVTDSVIDIDFPHTQRIGKSLKQIKINRSQCFVRSTQQERDKSNKNFKI